MTMAVYIRSTNMLYKMAGDMLKRYVLSYAVGFLTQFAAAECGTFPLPTTVSEISSPAVAYDKYRRTQNITIKNTFIDCLASLWDKLLNGEANASCITIRLCL